MGEKQYDISNLQLSIGDYTFVLQFVVKYLFCDDGDIILVSSWMEALGSFILNKNNKFLAFSYKMKKIALQDSTLESNPVTLENFKDISKVILQENKKSMQKEIITEKNKEISQRQMLEYKR
jgi:hypothetical protein